MKQKTYQTHNRIEKKQVISGEELRKSTKSRESLSFTTGRYMTEKDRPRKKKWSMEDY